MNKDYTISSCLYSELWCSDSKEDIQEGVESSYLMRTFSLAVCKTIAHISRVDLFSKGFLL